MSAWTANKKLVEFVKIINNDKLSMTDLEKEAKESISRYKGWADEYREVLKLIKKIE